MSRPGFWAALGLVLLLLVAQVAVASAIGIEGDAPSWLRASATNLIAFATVLALAAWWARRPPVDIAPLRPVPLPLLASLVPLAAGMGLLLSEVDNLFRTIVPMPAEFAEQMLALLRPSLLGGVLLAGVVAPLTEELFFRGLVLGAFLRRYTASKAIALSALLFALGHANPWQFASALLVGALLGWLFWRTGSLVPCLFTHALFNLLTVLAVHLLPPIQGFTGDPLGPVELQPLWLDALGLALTAVGALAVRRAAPRPA